MLEELPQQKMDEEIPQLNIAEPKEAKLPLSPNSAPAEPKLDKEMEVAIEDEIQDYSAGEDNIAPNFESQRGNKEKEKIEINP